MIKAVIFDIDGVLLDSFEANLKFYQNLLVHYGYQPPTRKEYPALSHLSLWDTIKNLTGLTSDEDIKPIWETGKNREVKYPIELLQLPEKAESVIAALNKNYLLGIVTSRVRKSVYEFSKLAAMKKYFPVVVSCDDTVNHKPHPEPLLLAAQKLGVKPEEAVYIGDAESDLLAARGAGMKIIIYSKNRLTNADACTSLFEKLPELIKSL